MMATRSDRVRQRSMKRCELLPSSSICLAVDPRKPSGPAAVSPRFKAGYTTASCGAANRVRGRIASPGMLLEGEPLPHLICSRPMFIGGVKDEADQHGGAGRVSGSDIGAVF